MASKAPDDKITLEQWKFDLGEAERGGEGWTSAEIAARCGWSVEKTRRKLGQAVAQSLWQLAGFRRGTSLDGRPTRIPVYAPARAERGK